jgi:hypothetical protein
VYREVDGQGADGASEVRTVRPGHYAGAVDDRLSGQGTGAVDGRAPVDGGSARRRAREREVGVKERRSSGRERGGSSGGFYRVREGEGETPRGGRERPAINAINGSHYRH